jgi:hypothetical protein
VRITPSNGVDDRRAILDRIAMRALLDRRNLGGQLVVLDRVCGPA